MKTTNLLVLVSTLLQLAGTVYAQQYQMPQDNWYFTGLRIDGSFGELTLGPDGNIYATATNGTIAVFNSSGTYLRNIGTNMNVAGIAFSSQGCAEVV